MSNQPRIQFEQSSERNFKEQRRTTIYHATASTIRAIDVRFSYAQQKAEIIHTQPVAPENTPTETPSSDPNMIGANATYNIHASPQVGQDLVNSSISSPTQAELIAAARALAAEAHNHEPAA